MVGGATPVAAYNDIAMVAEFEKKFHSGDDVITPFDICYTKTTWQSQSAHDMSTNGLEGQVATTFTTPIISRVPIQKAFDFLLCPWLRADISGCTVRAFRPIAADTPAAPLAKDTSIPIPVPAGSRIVVVRYCRNPGHQIYNEIKFSVADIDVEKLYPVNLDYNLEHMHPGKRDGAIKMIGDTI